MGSGERSTTGEEEVDARIDRLRREANTIVTRYSEVEQALERARSEEGPHWETGELELTIETPSGEPIELSIDLESEPDRAAQWRYDRASELEAERDRRAAIDDRLDPLPADPVAYLLCYHLNTVGGNYPRSMAGYVGTDRDRVVELCDRMLSTGLLERVEPGTVKQRNVKAKKSEEVRQHHTYYRLSREGDHLLRFLSEREGKLNALRHLPEGVSIARVLADEGTMSAGSIAETIDLEFETARHHCEALRRIGLAKTAGSDSYRPTSAVGSLLEELAE